MRKATRLFEIIQMVRLSQQPVTAAQIAAHLNVTVRSIYRDVQALQAMDVPIEGGRGIGYILRPGFELPPLMFSIEETEAIVLALALLQRTGDTGLKRAAGRVQQKIAAAIPPPLRRTLSATALHAWGTITPSPDGIELALVRCAIRDEQKLAIDYRDEGGRETTRTIRPIALIYYVATHNIVAWCDLRGAIRHFRTDRVLSATLADTYFAGQGEALRQEWMAGWTAAASAEVKLTGAGFG
jgi:predicted DNA-binding transcriptional regulator YafY